MTKSKTKSLAAAIGLNILLPGAGYFYMGRWLAGILGGALIIAISMRSSPENVFMAWAISNLVMIIDMCLLHSKRQAHS